MGSLQSKAPKHPVALKVKPSAGKAPSTKTAVANAAAKRKQAILARVAVRARSLPKVRQAVRKPPFANNALKWNRPDHHHVKNAIQNMAARHGRA
ncbi:hypothetical protein CYMTET_45934 [Cymbomonas tetramitiformis]|uniref:Uncharacterized protein n=1 Tax=Cymbomonas tetramitiformis TaxID=36881 RepID=A0AAE0BX71_9CHLO|nr:hypothetical protein CYMTET_45934 [Cymbomonas tetramitiformis]